ncbi:hypothetical protein T552_01388 [Pneumocystis carinii B80]|uniref:Major surface glycoprotein 2 C-terminal domain-containing protein n=2 Tax=Pneumocystis carinii TaxID=4754 RepID=A0A0W4ZM27_PNEC8|nr:hypothetical protein T552_01388 [Pneumocystis carinii B80]KTW29436.1 hypothetical protein T552_01388 [Pneumocystis carinii B80]CAH17869.1 Major Surface Glycoprotein type II (MSR), putative [Pneumocystis carinii]
MLFSKINKIIVLRILILIVPTYGNQSTHLKARDSQVSAANTPFKDIVVKDEEILAYILREDYKDKCELKLEEYCKELRDIDQGLNKVHTIVKEICDDEKRDGKCKELKDKVKKELETFKEELEKALKDIKDENCEKYEEKCILLEETNHDDIKKNCVQLREGCYIFKRENVAEELLLRALGGNAKEMFDCKTTMEDVCPVLIQKSDELMSFCLNPNKTCENLKKKMKDICKPIEELNENELAEKCYERLEKCHFYGEACADAKCQVFEEECKKNNITYKAPGSDSSPVEPKPSLLTRIGLDAVYKKAEKDGIFIGKQGADLPRRFGDYFLQSLLLLLSEDENDAKKKCPKALSKCDYFAYFDDSLSELCISRATRTEKCKELLDVKERCTKLKINLYLKGLSTVFKDEESELLSWGQLSTLFTKGECIELESECFYLRKACKDNKIDQACKNVRAACYKMGQNRMLNRFFQKELKGKLGDLRFNSESLKKCQEYVVENCAKLKDKRYLPKCLYPKELCYAVSDNIVVQSRELGVLLDGQRDSPLEKHCLELGEKCDELDRDSYLNSGKCATLKRRCEFFNVTKRFRKEFLKRKDDSLMTQDNCTKALHEKCEALSKRGKNPFKVSCALPGETCKYMVHHTRQDCFYLSANMENEEILEGIGKANETLVEKLCTTWGPYCHQFMENCPSTLKKNKINQGYNCEELDEKCRDTFKKLELEEELSHLLKGSLSNGDQCKEALKKRCTELEKNKTFNDLLGDCEEGAKGDICKKLVDKLQKRCPTLKTELKKAEKELKVKKDEYDKVKKAAEDSTETAKLLLSRPKQDKPPNAQNGSDSTLVPPPQQAPAGSSGSGSLPAPGPSIDGKADMPGGASGTPSGIQDAADGTTNNAKLGLVKRAYVDGEVSEAEVKAFDATTIALELYLELKEGCKALQLDCGFKEDCKGLEVCEEIDKLCKEIKPLEIKPHHTETIIKEPMTVTMTETKTIDKADGKTGTKTITIAESVGGGKVTEQCTLVRTTDIWVTSTSLHTSTVTSTPTVTSTVTLTSMRKCKPTKCTTDSSKETDKGEDEEEEVKPNDGMKIRVPDMIKIMLLGVIVMGMM